MGSDEVVILNRVNKFVSWVPCLFSFRSFGRKDLHDLEYSVFGKAKVYNFLFWDVACEVTEWNLRENQ